MKKRSQFLLLVLACLIIIPASLAETTLYEGWLPAYSSIVVEGVNYTITHNSQIRIVSIVSSFESAVIDLEQCQTLTYYKYCFNENRSTGWDYDKDRPIYEVHISISSLLPDIEVDTELTPEDSMLLEDITIIVTLENTGDKPAQNIYYEAEFPIGIVIKKAQANYTNTRVEGPKLVWSGILAPAQVKQFQYVIWPFATIDQEIIANITYNYEEYNFSTTTTFDLDVGGESGIEHEAEWIEDTVELNERAYFNINISNKYDRKTVEITNLTINLPEGMEFDSSTRELIKVTDRMYKTSIKLYSEQSIGFQVKVKPRYSGQLNVTIDYNNMLIEGNNVGSLYNDNITLTVEDFKELTPSIVLSAEVFSENQFGTANVYLRNNNSDLSFINVKAVFASEFGLYKDMIAPIIKDGINLHMTTVTFRAPQVDTPTFFNITFNGSYETEYGQSLDFNLTRSIEVLPVKEVLNVSKIAEPMTGLKGGDEVLVKVYVHNIGSVWKDNIDVYETYPGSFSKKRGKTSDKIMALDPNEKKMVYDYTLIVPKKISTEIVTLTTTVKFQDQGFDFVTTKDINISIILPEKPKITVVKTIDTNVTKGNPVNITYTIKNDDPAEATNMVITPFKQKEFDLVGTETISVGGVAGLGEKNVTLTIVPKITGAVTLESDNYVFKDYAGNTFDGTINTLDVVVEDATADRPLIVIDKAPSVDSAKINESFEVTLLVQNVGNIETNFTIKDNNAVWNPILDSMKSKTLNYSFMFTSDNTQFDSRAKATYLVNDIIHYAYSNSKGVTFDPTTPAGTASTDQTTDTDTGDTDSGDTEEKEEKKSNFFSNIFKAIGNFFKKLFGKG